MGIGFITVMMFILGISVIGAIIGTPLVWGPILGVTGIVAVIMSPVLIASAANYIVPILQQILSMFG